MANRWLAREMGSVGFVLIIGRYAVWYLCGYRTCLKKHVYIDCVEITAHGTHDPAWHW